MKGGEMSGGYQGRDRVRIDWVVNGTVMLLVRCFPAAKRTRGSAWNTLSLKKTG